MDIEFNEDQSAAPPVLDITGNGPDAFHICDEQSANWLVRKILEARAYRNHVKQWATSELRRAAEDEKRLVFLFGQQLQEWTTSELRRLGGRRKSLYLPAGRVGYRQARAKFVIDDADAVLRWARAACPEAVVVTEQLDKTVLDAHLLSSGELPDSGAHVEPGHERFHIG